MTDKRAIVWIFDSGVQHFFPTCLFSLKQCLQSEFHNYVLIVIDCGLTTSFREWISTLNAENLVVLPVEALNPALTLGQASSGAGAASVMRVRVELNNALRHLCGIGQLPRFERFMQLDVDTAFLRDPDTLFLLNMHGASMICAPEWDWQVPHAADVQVPMYFVRDSTFGIFDYPPYLGAIAEALEVEVRELYAIPTYNSGIWMSELSKVSPDGWRAMYSTLSKINAQIGASVLSWYSIEQNALSLAIYKGLMTIVNAPRKFNYLPPRLHHRWPNTAIIAHFVTFGKNSNRPQYQLHAAIQTNAIETNFVPRHLVEPQ